ncbi:MAG: histidinol-phosphatase HisJ family protein [Oscillospiraceae bacterium]|nr:histidinol-phosphatase HisJ family protein [Oscillospiraceae bacterium]
MIPLQNLHTHCTFCDGKDEAEEVVKEALKLGMTSLGFSSHSFTGNPKVDGMSDERGYIECIKALKAKYRDEIEIFLGVERDCFTEISGLEDEYDYKIGSVHYLKIGDEYEAVDWSKERLKNTCEKYFDGYMMSLCEAYFELESRVVEMTGCQIIGHFDLVTLFSGLDDTANRRFIDAEMTALDELLKTDALFEVNTGAMARGYRTVPYPSEKCLRRIKEKNGRVIISSDCHDKSKLLYGFDTAAGLLQKSGFKEVYILTDGGFKPIRLET